MPFTWSLSSWLPSSLILLVGFHVNTAILCAELVKRRKGGVLFTSNWSAIFSLASIVCGALLPLCNALAPLPILCYLMFKASHTLAFLQFTLMGFYQLDRLYYCFSQNTTHTAKAYPLWLFVFMYVYGVAVSFLSFSFWYFIDIKHGKCYIDVDADYAYRDTFNRQSSTAEFGATVAFVYTVWDMLTLLLYACKARTLRKRFPADSSSSNDLIVRQRITSILQRVLILTFLYEVVVVLVSINSAVASHLHSAGLMPLGLTFVISQSASSVITITTSLSMFLMQQHNTTEYRQFLMVLKRLRVHYLCCFCCLAMIAREIEEHSVEQHKHNEAAAAVKGVDDTMFETRSMGSLKVEHSGVVDVSVMTEDIVTDSTVDHDRDAFLDDSPAFSVLPATHLPSSQT